jgi:PAS domain S-box-containing protein
MDYVGTINTEDEIVAVVGMGVNMDKINQFLLQNSGTGTTYIYDAGGKVIANSTGKDLVEYISELPPEAYPEDALNSSDERIRESARFIKENQIPDDQTFRIMIKGIRYFGLVSTMDKPEGAGFHIVILMPESDIIGDTLKKQRLSLAILALIFLIGTLLGSLVIRKILKPILQITESASKITDANFDTLIEEPKNSIAEFHALIEALNKMIGKIQQSVSEIKASEKNFRSLVENSDDFIFNLTSAGKIMSVNESFVQYMQKDRSELIGESIERIIRNEDERTLWHEQWQKMLSMQGKVSFSFNSRSEDQEQRIFNVQLVPQFDDSGRLTHVIGTFTDVTELMENRKKIEELLMNENERLEAQIKIKTKELNETLKELMEREKMASLGSLVAGISHEINTPLGVAVSACSFLADENRKVINTINSGSLTREGLSAYLENTDESTRIIQNNLNRAASLIASFKSVSVDQSSEKEVRFNLYDYIQSILLMLKHEYKNTGHQIEVDCPKELGIYSYPGAYSQIFTNLIMNSLIHGFKNTEAGTISIKVAFENGDAQSGRLRIEYRDNGSGIPKEALKHIFDPFFTTGRGTSTKSGSGLGLNILYNLVTSKLGGSVKCESEPGKGVLFSMVIPYKE